MMKLSNDFLDLFKDKDTFDDSLNLDGKVFRTHKNRKTFRITKNGKGYFIKTFRRTGWNEIFKNLIQLKWPVLSAMDEVHAICRLEELGIPTMKMAGFGIRGIPLIRLESFIITEELENTVSLEKFSQNWAEHPPDFSLKLAILRKVAGIAKGIHQNGINHRDFYICHFLLDMSSFEKDTQEGLKIYLIDLHRTQLRTSVPQRWIIKDISGLFFSSMNTGLTRRDLFRFMKTYSGKGLREILENDMRFWSKVRKKAIRLYIKHFRRLPTY